jgi:hypothetical protein
MTSDIPFRHLAPYFHQDLDVVHGTIENAVATAAIELKPEARKDVHDFAANRAGPVHLNSFPGFLSEVSAIVQAAAGSCSGVK